VLLSPNLSSHPFSLANRVPAVHHSGDRLSNESLGSVIQIHLDVFSSSEEVAGFRTTHIL